VSVPRVTESFFRLTTERGGQKPSSTVQAMANLARDPEQNVEAIYRLTQRQASYRPSLLRVPDAWTVTVKVNDSGSDAILFGGPGNLAFDSRGYAWLTNNVDQGYTTSSHSVVVLKPNGQPADGKNGTPLSPLTGAGILGTGFGVTVDPHDSAWFGNFGWGGVDYQPSPDGNGSVSQFSASGAPVSVPNGYQGGPDRVQGMAADADGNIWMSSFGNDSLYVFPGGDPDGAVGFTQYKGSQPFDVALAADGTCWVTNSGGFVGEYPSSIAKFALVGGVLERQFQHFLGSALKGVAVDSLGNAWVASLGDNLVYAVRPDGTMLGSFGGGGLEGPWGWRWTARTIYGSRISASSGSAPISPMAG
jgi:hypothetical protein